MDSASGSVIELSSDEEVKPEDMTTSPKYMLCKVLRLHRLSRKQVETGILHMHSFVSLIVFWGLILQHVRLPIVGRANEATAVHYD